MVDRWRELLEVSISLDVGRYGNHDYTDHGHDWASAPVRRQYPLGQPPIFRCLSGIPTTWEAGGLPG
jgi:hypothetical protein